jgi:hypothetical protein
MNFINPFVLFGLLAASIPVLLHLLNLRKLRTVEFSSLKFLKELQKTKIRKLKLKQILLLILRTLIIIFAVLAFARPTIPGAIPFFESYSKTSAIIIVDNSFSMDISDEYGNRFNQMKKQASNIISTLGDGDEVAVITMSDEDNYSGIYSRNFDFAYSKINEIKVSLTPANLNRSLRKAESLLNDASNINKEIYIISDAQSNIFKILNYDTVRIKTPAAMAVFIPLGSGSKADLQNISVDSIKIISRIFQHDKLVEAEAFIRNGSKNSINDVVVGMDFDGKSVAQRSADIKSGETKSFLIAAQPGNSGQIKAHIEVESDIQDFDNKRYFGFTIPPKPRLLVAMSQDNPYIKTALISLIDKDNSSNIKFNTTSQLSSEDFNNYDALILADGKISANDYERINQYINSGGSVLTFANSDFDQSNYMKFLKDVGIGNLKDMKFSSVEPASFGNIDSEHPVFDGVFETKAQKNSQIESPKILKGMPAENARALITMPGGAFFAESKKGEGKILYFAVAPQTDWSNFPLTGIFPAIIYRSVLYLTASEDLSINIRSGEPLIFKVPNKFSTTSNFKVIDPNKNTAFYQSVKLPQGDVISFEKLMIPGIYTILDDNDKYVSQIAVNLDESESLMTSLDEDKIKSNLSERLPKIPVTVLEPTQEIKGGINRARTGTELWQIFILLAILAAIAEMIVQRVSKIEVGEG